MSVLSSVTRLYPALGIPSFRLLWLGTLPATIAWQMSVVASGYAAFVLSGSATALGVISLATGLPMLVFSLVGGVVADRLPRLKVLYVTQSSLGAAAGVVALLALSNRLAVWHLVALALVQGAAFSFNMPARQALSAELVGRRHLRSAVALNTAGMNLSRVAGPSLGGALLAVPFIGVGGVFVLMTLMYGVVLASLTRLSSPAPASPPAPPPAPGSPAAAPPPASGWAQLLEGLRYVRSSSTLLTLLLLAFLPLVFGMHYQTLMPLFAEEIFLVGAAGLGVLMAASGSGALVGSFIVAGLSNLKRPALLQMTLGVVFGLALVAFALAPAVELAIAALLVVGFSFAGYASINNMLVLANTEPRLHGRVLSLLMLTFAVAPVAGLPAAWLADLVGGRLTIAAAGCIVAVTVAAVALLYPPARGIK